MKATTFLESVKNFRPSLNDFVQAGFGSYAQKLLEKYYYEEHDDKLYDNELVDLVSNYDVSKLEIGMISFNSKIEENSTCYFFGRYEVDILAINKASKEIVMLDNGDIDFVMRFCAVDANHFLDAMFVALKAITLFLLDNSKAKDGNYRSNIAAECTKLAGGDKYFSFFNDLVGLD